MFDIDKLIDRLEAAEKERDALRAEVIHIKEVEFPRKAQAVADGWRGKLEAAEKERDALRAMLMVALDVLEEVKGNINPERGYADELEADVERAIATIVIPGAKGE